ncbi:hypothetical protein FM21_15200 [Streptomyces mutabilis]|uniref:Uncharacterized protein n=1 Tax=Streptomyces mutabilis TaxID=67332 RepID=A0A086N867_9ACTN|nr:hypothetical protein FM21_15200 [Streptomyces mutabilis]
MPCGDQVGGNGEQRFEQHVLTGVGGAAFTGQAAARADGPGGRFRPGGSVMCGLHPVCDLPGTRSVGGWLPAAVGTG